MIRNYEFISYRSADDDTVYRGKASDLYWPTEDLHKYFEPKPDTRFVELNEYKALVGKKNITFLESFLTELGVEKEPSVIEHELDVEQAYKIRPSHEWNRPAPYNMNTRKWIDRYIDGCTEIIDNVSAETSNALWNQLLRIISSRCSRWRHLEKVIYGTYKYFYHVDKSESFESSEARRLRTKPWLLNSEGEFVSARELTFQKLSRNTIR